MSTEATADIARDALTTERARLFALLGRLLVAAPDAGLLAALQGLRGDRTPLGETYGALAEAAAATDPVTVEREFHDLFIGLGRGELLPFASYYLTGFLHERPLAELRGDLVRLGLERAAGVSEPEDHVGSECEVYAGLLSGSFEGGAAEAEAFFGKHLRPWAGRFFADLEKAEAGRFYRAVGQLGRVAVEIEQAALGLPA
ncbi:TorD/DmsD family molecular chaperone [Neoroseomonas soli]|uniref:Molecular chaperone TorD n=1 Tax=Neoroseomonas soli TaxID=1081025 RepID=A0A9X9WRU5_9PROT|nr:molecular chaperone TorD family protein [Neoroseomonas soli]MBR0669874.1 molecular chaperone TorD [Neoroseomonas soli]